MRNYSFHADNIAVRSKHIYRLSIGRHSWFEFWQREFISEGEGQAILNFKWGIIKMEK
jgi:hypothetical protein